VGPAALGFMCECITHNLHAELFVARNIVINVLGIITTVVIAVIVISIVVIVILLLLAILITIFLFYYF
jgi:hypothetical protein